MMQKKETIIVGAGIAGLSIAWELFQQNKSFVIYNHQSNLPSASLVAAGTWNPLNFKRLVPTWEINLFLDSMEKFYAQIETFFNVKCFYPIAVKKMHTHKIPASITLAQGVLESGSGRSELALKSNNHFGIKCHTDWSGERVTHDDDEKGECFRKYEYSETSYEDHSAFLTQRKRYEFLFSYGVKEYKKWARGLKDAGYATDPKYPEKLVKIIEDYQLHEFDKIKEKDFKYPKIDKKIDKNPEEIKDKTVLYEVQKGDTLYSISKRFMISIEDLKNRNGLKDYTISIGQKLIIK